jgi:excinuclease ABC subunit C
MKPPKFMNKIKELPGTPGVYLFFNSKKKIIYVGKAKNLKKRVSSYFQRGRAHDNRLELLVNEVSNLKTINTSSEAEALIYEAGLIKDHKPKFNIELKDDKSYPFLKLTINDDFPRLIITRVRKEDGAVYYGPYTNVKLLKEAVEFIRKMFMIRGCRNMSKKVCLRFHIEQCYGPCEGKISKREYGKTIKYIRAFLEGRKSDLIRSFQKDMKRYSAKWDFEKAMVMKKRIEALTAVQNAHDSSSKPIFGELDELQNALGLKKTPDTIECFDISNIAGKQAVGSMVQFKDGKPQKNEYRKFKIKKVAGIDDYSMIREVVRRRYTRLLAEEKPLPDLVLIDGGKGHLSVAQKELKILGLNKLPIASIAKEFNHLYRTTAGVPIRLSPGSRLLFLIQRIRDEAHRFAITYHRKLRSKEAFM